MADDIREAFLSHIPAERLQESGEDDALLPMVVVPDALERLGLDGDDDFVLSILRDVAEPIGGGAGARRRGQSEMGIPYDQWKEVVEVLLAQQQQEDAQARGASALGSPSLSPSPPQPEPEPEEHNGRRRRLPARAARATSSSWAVGDEEEDDEDDEDEDMYEAEDDDDVPAGGGGVRRRRTRAADYPSDQEESNSFGSDEEGGFMPVRKATKRLRTTRDKGSGRLTDAHHERANYVAGLLLDQLDPVQQAESTPSVRDPSARRFGPQDLVAVANKMGDTLSLEEVRSEIGLDGGKRLLVLTVF